MKKLYLVAACLATIPTAASAAILPDLASFGPASKIREALRNLEQKTIYLPLPDNTSRPKDVKPSANKPKNIHAKVNDVRKA